MYKFFLIFFFLSLFLSNKVDLEGFKVITIDKQTNSKIIELNSGDNIALKFAGNPTTGYIWLLEIEPDHSILKPINLKENKSGEYVGDYNSRAMLGSGGQTYFKFQAITAGSSASMKFVYKRPWNNEDSIKEVIININII